MHRPLLALVTAVLVLQTEVRAQVPDTYGLDKAQAGVAKLTVAEGLTVSLFAAEPMVQNPTNMDIDARGRVWITEAANYRKWANPPIRPEGDRIMVLEDTLGKGVADKATVYYQDPSINSALGIAVLGNDVIVSVSPYVFLLRDTVGDGVAHKRFILLTGTGGKQHDHSTHAFVHGTDGKLYFNFGNASTELNQPMGGMVEVPLHGDNLDSYVRDRTTHVKDLAGNTINAQRKPYQQGMAFRADYADGKLSNFEVLGNNFRNNYEVVSDSLGNIFQSDNDDDGNRGVRINFMMEHGNYGYADEMTGSGWQTKRVNIESEIPRRHWHQNDPGVVPNLIVTGAGSPTGILVNEGTGLGAQFQNQIIHCDAGPGVVRAYPLTKDGAGFRASITNILTSKDPWFRPADVAVHPDGSLFVADWYDAGVGGHAMADHDVNYLRGRIYRVANKGATLVAPKVSELTLETALAALQSPNKATQYNAYTHLVKLGDSAVPALQALAAKGDNRMRARALAILVRNPAAAVPALRAALTDKDPELIVAALRLAAMRGAGHQLETSPLANEPGLVNSLINHADPQVRRQLAISLYHSSQGTEIWAKLAAQHDGVDRWNLEALGIGAIGNDDKCFDAWMSEVKGNWNTAGGRDIVWRLRTPKVAPLLAQLLIADPSQLRYLRSFDFLPDSPERDAALLQLAKANPSLTVLTESLQRLTRTAAKNTPEFKAIVEETLARSQGKPAFVDLIGAMGVGKHADELLQTAFALGSAPEALDAINLLLRDKGTTDKVRDVLRKGKPSEASMLIAMLGNLGQTSAKEILRDEILHAKTPERKSEAIRALAKTQAGASQLLTLAKEGHFPSELRGVAASALTQVQYAALKNDIAREFPTPGSLGGNRLPSIPELSKLRGDAAQGKVVFERPASSCTLCHRIGNLGVDFGPALSGIGAKLPKEAIFDSIINPNAGISMGFETTELSLRGNSTAMGILRSETAQEVVLALPGGALQKFSTADIQRRSKQTTSMMPSGLNQALTQQDLVDLVEYLSTQKAVK